MNPLILDGNKAREALLPALKEKVASLIFTPTLAIIQVGDRADSGSYIRGKKLFAQKIGIKEKHVQLPEIISQKELIEQVLRYNADPSIQGIIVQLPLPLHIDREAVLNAVDPLKDVDALSAVNVKKWLDDVGDSLLPATARGVRELLKFYNIQVEGKHAVVVGRSELVGKPIAAMCVNEGATVTVCHSKTLDLIAETMLADILIVAIGKPHFITSAHVKKGAVVIDVGMNRDDEGKLCGDVDFDKVKEVAGYITPVPGGVGPMTITMLLVNTIESAERV